MNTNHELSDSELDGINGGFVKQIMQAVSRVSVAIGDILTKVALGGAKGGTGLSDGSTPAHWDDGSE